MKFSSIIFAAALFASASWASAQGFINLDFEDATIAPTPPGSLGSFADPAQAFPGWTVGGGASVFYNDLSLGGPAVGLIGPDFPNGTGYTPLEGSYSVLLQYFDIPSLGTPTLSQTGLVPANAESISFMVPSGGSASSASLTVLSLNGVDIPLVPISNDRVAGNISAFAGTTADLSITTVNNSEAWIYLDDIQFSPSPVPEPGEFGLFALGVLSLCFRSCRKSASIREIRG